MSGTYNTDSAMKDFTINGKEIKLNELPNNGVAGKKETSISYKDFQKAFPQKNIRRAKVA